MRLFIAVHPPTEALDDLERTVDDLLLAGPGWRHPRPTDQGTGLGQRTHDRMPYGHLGGRRIVESSDAGFGSQRT